MHPSPRRCTPTIYHHLPPSTTEPQAQLHAQTDAAEAAARREAESEEAMQSLRAGSTDLEVEIAALRSEMAQREEEFQVELNLFAERHDELSGAARRAEAEALAQKARADALQQALGGTRGREDELVNEVGNLNAALDALTEQNGQLQRDYAELSQRHRQQGADLSMASASLQVTQETGDARHAMLAGRLEASLRELQAADRWRVVRDSACGAVWHARRVARDAQLSIYRSISICRRCWASVTRSRRPSTRRSAGARAASSPRNSLRRRRRTCRRS